MYGFNHLPPIQNAISVTEFTTPGVGTDNSDSAVTKPYTIPLGATFLYVLLVGGGANGGTPVVGAGVTGGGAGGSGSITKALIPCFLLPQNIYVNFREPTTGAGSTRLMIRPQLISPQLDTIISASNGRNGAAGGSAGVGGVVMTNALANWAGTLALWVSQAGAAGGAGSTTNGAAVTALATLPLTGGGGGGGSSAGTGGNVTGAGPFPTISGGASGENPGRPGYMLRQPFGGVGGSGGGGVNAAGTGLNFGGPGAIGCGGGGGGNAASGTPGAGGKGGPGYCLIVAF